jgi:hypothetical protein
VQGVPERMVTLHGRIAINEKNNRRVPPGASRFRRRSPRSSRRPLRPANLPTADTAREREPQTSRP